MKFLSAIALLFSIALFPFENPSPKQPEKKNRYEVIGLKGDRPGYAKIQDAIEAARSEGASSSRPAAIIVDPGKYEENLIFYDGIEIEGPDGEPLAAEKSEDLSVEIKGSYTLPREGSVVLKNLTFQMSPSEDWGFQRETRSAKKDPKSLILPPITNPADTNSGGGSSGIQFNTNSGSATPAGGIITITGGATGLTTNGAGSTVSLAGTLGVANGGTGRTSLTANGLLFGNGASPVGITASATSATLVTNNAGVPSFTSSMTDGQVLIGSTGMTPVPATLTAGTGISITSGAGSITIATTGSALQTLTGNTGGAVSPTAGNINTFGTSQVVTATGSTADGGGLLISGNAGTSTLTATWESFGTQNTFLGVLTGNNTLTGNSNSGFGNQCLSHLTAGTNNVAVGVSALRANGSGNSNVAVGSLALESVTGSANTALGFQTLKTLLTGSLNIAIGSNAGSAYSGAESSNILIGSQGSLSENNVCRIGQTSSAGGVSITDFYIGANTLHIENGEVVNSRTVTAASDTASATDYVLACNSAGAIALALMASPETGRVFIVKDISGAAGTNNITITPAAGNIDGQPTYVINTNYGAVDLVYTGTEWSAASSYKPLATNIIMRARLAQATTEDVLSTVEFFQVDRGAVYLSGTPFNAFTCPFAGDYIVEISSWNCGLADPGAGDIQCTSTRGVTIVYNQTMAVPMGCFQGIAEFPVLNCQAGDVITLQAHENITGTIVSSITDPTQQQQGSCTIKFFPIP